jgi:hypothetical protein
MPNNFQDNTRASIQTEGASGVRHRKFKSFRHALKSVRTKPGLDRVSECLTSLREELDSHVLFVARYVLSFRLHLSDGWGDAERGERNDDYKKSRLRSVCIVSIFRLRDYHNLILLPHPPSFHLIPLPLLFLHPHCICKPPSNASTDTIHTIHRRTRQCLTNRTVVHLIYHSRTSPAETASEFNARAQGTLRDLVLVFKSRSVAQKLSNEGEQELEQ